VKSYTNFVPPDETTPWLNGVIGLVALTRYDEAKALFRPGRARNDGRLLAAKGAAFANPL